MGEVKAHLDLTQCVFEFEGDKDFVVKELVELRELVKAGLLPVQPAVSEDEQVVAECDVNASESGGADLADSSTPLAKKNKQRKVQPPKILNLDFRGNGRVALQGYAEEKKPTSDADKFVVIAHWLKTELNLDDVGNDHIYTCFKALKWRIPKDIAQGFRNAKNRLGAFGNGATAGTFRLTTVGENRATLDLPRKK